MDDGNAIEGFEGVSTQQAGQGPSEHRKIRAQASARTGFYNAAPPLTAMIQPRETVERLTWWTAKRQRMETRKGGLVPHSAAWGKCVA